MQKQSHSVARPHSGRSRRMASDLASPQPAVAASAPRSHASAWPDRRIRIFIHLASKSFTVDAEAAPQGDRHGS